MLDRCASRFDLVIQPAAVSTIMIAVWLFCDDRIVKTNEVERVDDSPRQTLSWLFTYLISQRLHINDCYICDSLIS